MRYLSLFSGIEAASVAWEPLGWECVGVCEFDPFPSAVLAQRYPDVPNFGDVTQITEADIAALGQIDLVVFGSPCQDLSLAGKRKGFQGERSSLFFTAIQIVDWAREWGGCRWALWENVPGAFSANQGRDFAAVVDAMAGLEDTPVPPKGWGKEGCAVGSKGMVEWAVLDAQWFGVAQRRRRVFALADFGDWPNRPPILLEPEGLRGDSAPSRGTGQEAAGTLASRTGAGGFPRTDEACSGYVQPVTFDRQSSGEYGTAPIASTPESIGSRGWPADVACTLYAAFGQKLGLENQHIDGGAQLFVPVSVHGTQDPVTLTDLAHTLGRNQGQENALVLPSHRTLNIYGGNKRRDRPNGGFYVRLDEPASKTLDAASGLNPACNQGGTGVLTPTQVRRLTPIECERLQAFPDNWTQVMWKGKPAPDSLRYKALGNSMCVNVMRWIGQQIDMAEMFS